MYKKLLGIVTGILFVLSAVQAEASKGLYADHLQHGMEMKKQKTPKEEIMPLLPKRQHHRINWDKILKLSKQQQAQVEAIYNESEPAIADLRDQIHEAHRKIGDIYREDDLKIREILDEQQRIKFDKYQYHRTKRSGGKPDEERPSRKRMSVF